MHYLLRMSDLAGTPFRPPGFPEGYIRNGTWISAWGQHGSELGFYCTVAGALMMDVYNDLEPPRRLCVQSLMENAGNI